MLCETITEASIVWTANIWDPETISVGYTSEFTRFGLSIYYLLANVVMGESFFVPRFFAVKEMWWRKKIIRNYVSEPSFDYPVDNIVYVNVSLTLACVKFYN